MILASCRPGDAVILPRDAHMSALGGLILAGARPVYSSLGAMEDRSWGPPDLEDLSAALASQAPRAVLLTRPSYAGSLFDLDVYAERIHAAGVTLLVDEAHGAHVGLHPALPEGALALGADAAVQSTHKMLGALTPGAMLHLKGGRLDQDRVHRALSLLQTTSPSYLVLASLDAARRKEALAPPERWEAPIRWARLARERIAGLPGLRVMPPGDPLKIGIDVTGAGLSGYEAADILAQEGVIIEHATHRLVVAFMGPGTRPGDLERLAEACLAFARHAPRNEPDPPMPPIPPMVLLPREAFFAESRPIPWSRALGEVSAELVCPYPPGAPALVPGERITPEVVEYLDDMRALGAQFVGPADPNFETIRIMA